MAHPGSEEEVVTGLPDADQDKAGGSSGSKADSFHQARALAIGGAAAHQEGTDGEKLLVDTVGVEERAIRPGPAFAKEGADPVALAEECQEPTDVDPLSAQAHDFDLAAARQGASRT